MKSNYLTCPICNEFVYVDTYTRDDRRRFKIHCENDQCECFPVRGREYNSFIEAEQAWKKAYRFIY
jgi:hypothetical protein